MLHLTIPVPHVALIATFVPPSISPSELAFAFHHVVFPLSIVSLAVRPVVHSSTFDVIVPELPFIFSPELGWLLPVSPDEFSLSFFEPVQKLPVVLTTISLGLLSLTMLLVLVPVSYV